MSFLIFLFSEAAHNITQRTTRRDNNDDDDEISLVERRKGI